MSFLGFSHVIILTIVLPTGIFAYIQWVKWRQRSKHLKPIEKVRVSYFCLLVGATRMTRCPLLAYKLETVTTETVPSKGTSPVELETVMAENAPPSKVAPQEGNDPPQQKRRSVGEAMASLKQRSWKHKKEKIQKAPRLFLQKSWEALTDDHTILSLFFSGRSNFPRSDRVLVFLAYLMSQFFVIGLFRNSAVIQDQWVCTLALSDALLRDALNGTDGLINGTAASYIIWINGTASSIGAKGWCDSECGSNSTIKQNTKTAPNSRRKKGGGGGGGGGGTTSTVIVSPMEQQCNDFCDCASQPPEAVYIISHAILVILLSSLPVTIMAVSFTIGCRKVRKANALSVNITLQKLEKAIDKFKLQQANFVAIMGNTIFIGCFSAADAVAHLLLLHFRGSLKILTASEAEKTGREYHGVLNVLVDKKQRSYWADVLLMNLVAMMDVMSKKKTGQQQSTLLHTTDFLLNLEIMQESYKNMCSVVVDNAAAARNVDQLNDNVKVAKKNKRMGLTIVTLSYFLGLL
jgi:hypothetical protein